MGSLYLWLKFIHVLAGFTFIMGHGVAVFMAFRLKQEIELPRVRALLELSSASFKVFMLSLLVLLVDGIVIAFMGAWWGTGWIWLSLVILVGIFFWMARLGLNFYHPLRKAVGLPYMQNNREMPAEEPQPETERAALIVRTNPSLQLWVGYGGFALILWLMMFKPF